MATNTEQYGPKGVRMECIQLTLIDTESEHTGWRKPNKERQETLKNIFLGGAVRPEREQQKFQWIDCHGRRHGILAVATVEPDGRAVEEA